MKEYDWYLWQINKNLVKHIKSLSNFRFFLVSKLLGGRVMFELKSIEERINIQAKEGIADLDPIYLPSLRRLLDDKWQQEHNRITEQIL